jgi:hypothetical protein
MRAVAFSGSLVALGLAALASAQSFPGGAAVRLTPGQSVSGPEVLDLTLATFRLPVGWTATGGDEPQLVVLTFGQVSTLVTAKPATAGEVRRQLGGPIDLGQGVVLEPVTQVLEIGDTLRAGFGVRGTAGAIAANTLVRVGTEGVSLGFIALGTPADVLAVDEALAAMASSAAFPATPARLPTAADGWETYLRGRYLVRLYTASGYHEKEEIWLCSDGSFRSAADFGGFGDAGSAAGTSRRSGTWRAEGRTGGPGQLWLLKTDGTTRQFPVEFRSEEFYLNGARWMRGDNELCE